MFEEPDLAALATNPQVVEDSVRAILGQIVSRPDREGLVETPARVARAIAELFGGYSMDPAAFLAKQFSEIQDYDEMVLLRNVEFYSTCEHHLLPIIGKAHVAYIPRDRVVGVSKIARVVEAYARRLQIQERMTRQIGDAIEEALRPKGAAVVLVAQHLCMSSRGVKKDGAEMVTSAMYGNFKENERTRSEFLSLCGIGAAKWNM